MNSENGFEVLTSKEQKIVLENFFGAYPFTRWGRIDWEKINNKVLVEYIDEIGPRLAANKKDNNDPCYIIWGMDNLPIIKACLNDILNNIDDVTAVGPDTWLYCPKGGWIIEFYHEGEVTLGLE